MSNLDALIATLNKDFGEKVLGDAEDLANERHDLISWSPVIDSLFGGGLESGSSVNITGPEKFFKTTAALTLAAQCQKKEYGERSIVYCDSERRLTKKHLTGIQGLDTSPSRFTWVRSVKGRILTGAEHLKIAETALRTVPGCIVIIDSQSSLVEDGEVEEGLDAKETRGGAAKLFSKFCRVAKDLIPTNDCILVCISHIIANTSGFGKHKVERSSNMWKYQRDYDLWVKGRKDWVGKDRQGNDRRIGFELDWVSHCSKGGEPGVTGTGYIRLGVGLDRVYEILQLATVAKLVRTQGSWYYFDFLGDEPPKFQGGQKAYMALEDNPEWYAELSKKINEFLKPI